MRAESFGDTQPKDEYQKQSRMNDYEKIFLEDERNYLKDASRKMKDEYEIQITSLEDEHRFLVDEIKDVNYDNMVLKEEIRFLEDENSCLDDEIKDLKSEIMILKDVDSTMSQPHQDLQCGPDDKKVSLDD
jgi:chromosome segregation ATPase